jgi:hypothetical protein
MCPPCQDPRVPRLVLQLCLAIVPINLAADLRAQEAPAYQRNRDVAFVNHGGGHGHHGGGYGGFYSPWFTPQYFSGTWYERPYPYHFDYYRMRYGTPPAQQTALDCPCAETPAQ